MGLSMGALAPHEMEYYDGTPRIWSGCAMPTCLADRGLC